MIPSEGFTVKSLCGCRLVFGPVPLSDFSMLASGFSKNAVIATDIANRIGATLVVGEPADLDELRKLDLPVSDQRRSDASGVTNDKVVTWLLNGERGSSSEAICKRMYGVPVNAGTSHPYDPDDLRRCLLFLDAVGAHSAIGVMADVSPEWAALVADWSRIVDTFRGEQAAGNRAPRTYSLMKQALNGAPIRVAAALPPERDASNPNAFSGGALGDVETRQTPKVSDPSRPGSRCRHT